MKAVILAAGQGTRLRPLTDHTPKCLIEVNGASILEHQLRALVRVGVSHAIVVTGFLGDMIEQKFGPHVAGIDMAYVRNPRFGDTNNLYSLWLAGNQLNDDVLLIEGDVLFEDLLLEDLLNNPHSDAAVVDTYGQGMEGTVIFEEGDIARSMVLKSRQRQDFDYRDALKTVNLYRFSRVTMRTLILPALRSSVDKGLTDQFYESVIADLIEEDQLKLGIHHVGGRFWSEIDTVEDLTRTQMLSGMILDKKGRRARDN